VPEWPLLPPGLTVRAKLDQPFEVANAYAGQPVEASTLESIQVRGNGQIPARSKLHGIVRRLLPLGKSAYLVSLEFDTLDTPEGPALFYGRLSSVEEITGVKPYLAGKKIRRMELSSGEAMDEAANAAGIPGVGVFLINGRDTLISKDAAMVWKIQDLAPRSDTADTTDSPLAHRPPHPGLPATIH
jgi:hypothetical protein